MPPVETSILYWNLLVRLLDLLLALSCWNSDPLKPTRQLKRVFFCCFFFKKGKQILQKTEKSDRKQQQREGKEKGKLQENLSACSICSSYVLIKGNGYRCSHVFSSYAYLTLLPFILFWRENNSHSATFENGLVEFMICCFSFKCV